MGVTSYQISVIAGNYRSFRKYKTYTGPEFKS